MWCPYWCPHVGLGERPALGAELRAELVEEAEVDVDVLVDGTEEGPDARVGRAAPGARLIGHDLSLDLLAGTRREEVAEGTSAAERSRSLLVSGQARPARTPARLPRAAAAERRAAHERFARRLASRTCRREARPSRPRRHRRPGPSAQRRVKPGVHNRGRHAQLGEDRDRRLTDAELLQQLGEIVEVGLGEGLHGRIEGLGIVGGEARRACWTRLPSWDSTSPSTSLGVCVMK